MLNIIIGVLSGCLVLGGIIGFLIYKRMQKKAHDQLNEQVKEQIQISHLDMLKKTKDNTMDDSSVDDLSNRKQ